MVFLQRLWGLQIVEGEDMVEHLNKFRELANQVESLSVTGNEIENNELVTILSLSFPASYEPVIMALQSRADEVSLDTFTGKLLLESARRQIVDTTQHSGSTTGSNAAFTARFTPEGRGHSSGHHGPGRGGRRIASGLAIGRAGGSLGLGKVLKHQRRRENASIVRRKDTGRETVLRDKQTKQRNSPIIDRAGWTGIHCT